MENIALNLKARTPSPNLKARWFTGPMISPNVPDRSGNSNHLVPFVGTVENINTIRLRANLTSYAVGAFVEPNPANGYLYECTAITTGTSAAAQPAMNTTIGGTTVDDGVTWTTRQHHVPGAACWSSTSVILKAGDATVLDITAQNRSVLISWWFKQMIDIGASGAFISKNDMNTADASETGFKLQVINAAQIQLSWAKSDNTVVNSNGTVKSLNAWHHVLFARDQQASAKIYVDGVLDLTVAPFAVKSNTNAELLVGAAGTSASTGNPLSGIGGEVFVSDMQVYYKDASIATLDLATLAAWLYNNPRQILDSTQFA